MLPQQKQIQDRLEQYAECPDTLYGGSATVDSIEITEKLTKIGITCNFPIDLHKGEICSEIEKYLADTVATPMQINLQWKVRRHAAQKNLKGMDSVKNIIAVSAAKGGVGKSTVAVKLALALHAQGAKVGLLDADIYGPSIPKIFNLAGNPETKDGKRFEPFVCQGIEIMSVGFLVKDDVAMIWRGPMATAALSQLINDTNWSELDYLIIDMPPGTGDIPLTLAQKIPTSGAVLVTTSQYLAIADVKRSIAMFSRLDIAVLGMVENMNGFICPHCDKQSHLFEESLAEKLAKDNQVNFFTSIPLSASLASLGGGEVVSIDPENELDRIFTNLALKVSASLSLRAKDYVSKFPKIKISNVN